MFTSDHEKCYFAGTGIGNVYTDGDGKACPSLDTCFAFPSSSTFSLAPILLTMQYDHSKGTLGYILVVPDLEKVVVIYAL